MKRTMTLVLNNGASINLSTMLQTQKPLKLTQVSLQPCGNLVGSTVACPPCNMSPATSLQQPNCTAACSSCGICIVLPVMSMGVQPFLSLHANPLSLPCEHMVGTSKQLCQFFSPGLAF